MANEIQESPSDASSQKSVTDWLMHVISGKKPEDLLDEQARAEGVAPETNGHHATEAPRPEALMEMNALPTAAPHAAVAEEAFNSSAPVSVPIAATMDIFGLPLTSNGNGHVENGVAAAWEISADELCGPPAFGPVPKVALKEEITADDLCFVPKPPKAQSNGTAAEAGPLAAAFETSLAASAEPNSKNGFAEPEPRRYVLSTADILRERAPSLASEWINGNGHAQPVQEAAPVAETLAVAWPERGAIIPEAVVETQATTPVDAVSATVETPQEAVAVVQESPAPPSVSPEAKAAPETLGSLEPALSHEPAAAAVPLPEPDVIAPAALFESLAARISNATAVEPVEQPQTVPSPVIIQERKVQAVPEPVAIIENPEVALPGRQTAAEQAQAVQDPNTQTVREPLAEVENPEVPAAATKVQQPQVELVSPATPEAPQGAPMAIVPDQQTQGAGTANRQRVTKRMAKARRERVVTVADICRDWVLEEMLDRAAESGEIPKDEELEEDESAGLIEANAAEPAESVFAHEGIWGDTGRAESPEEGYQEQGLMTAGDAGLEAAREEVRSSGVKSLLKLGSMLPWLARDVPAVGGADNPQNTALTQEVRHEVAGMRVVQQEIRTTVHDHSLQLRRVEDQLSRVRESLVAEAAGSQDLVTSVKSTTKTVQVVGIAVCALLGFVLVMVMLLFLHSR